MNEKTTHGQTVPLEPAVGPHRTFTGRGFAVTEFRDRYGAACNLQQSSLAIEDAIWLGIGDPDPKVMASEAAALGVTTTETTGWVSYPLPPQVMLTTRMHLTRDIAAWLIEELQHFVDTGQVRPNASYRGCLK